MILSQARDVRPMIPTALGRGKVQRIGGDERIIRPRAPSDFRLADCVTFPHNIGMGRPVSNVITPGQRFGALTVIRQDGYDQYRCRMFEMRCDCGAVVRLRATHLNRRRFCSHSCSLLLQKRLTDLTGQKFGRWSVTGFAGTDSRGDAMWECVCSCGKKQTNRGFMLANGSSKSCGCSVEDRTIHKTPEAKQNNRRRIGREYNRRNPAKVKAGKIRYESQLERATPAWLTQEDWDAMNAMYRKAREMTRTTGIVHQVDHVLPIRGKTVSGLHVPGNLQILTQSANVSKSNRYAEHPGDWVRLGIKSPGDEQ